MSKIIALLILGIQVVVTFIVLCSLYMVFAILDSDFGFDGLVVLFVFMPIIAMIFSGLTILLCLLVGLPVRLNKKIHDWWTRHFYLAIAGAGLGLMLQFLSLFPAFAQTATIDRGDGQPVSKQIPNSIFGLTGWFLTAFSLLHVYPPKCRYKPEFFKLNC